MIVSKRPSFVRVARLVLIFASNSALPCLTAMLIGPGAGHMIADIVTGAKPIVDPKPYRPERLEGSAFGKVAEF